jgi:hypothetical protein
MGVGIYVEAMVQPSTIDQLGSRGLAGSANNEHQRSG